MLEVRDLCAGYGQGNVLFDVSLDVEKGQSVCLLGKNGAGKTTIMRCIIGLLTASSGQVTFEGRTLAGLPSDTIARLGIGYVPEDRRIFPKLTVEENLRVTRAGQGRLRPLGEVYEAFPILGERRRQSGGTLSGGEQQLLSIARALMGYPRLLLLDEPSEGLAPLVIRDLAAHIQMLKAQGLTLLIAEQNLAFARQLSDAVYIIDKGEIRYKGDFEQLGRDPELASQHMFVRRPVSEALNPVLSAGRPGA